MKLYVLVISHSRAKIHPIPDLSLGPAVFVQALGFSVVLLTLLLCLYAAVHYDEGLLQLPVQKQYIDIG